ncbi:DNA helicase MCM8-like [Leptopilina boulardi]|uniref:DNA helicase MCM8-like n=1 Tax=Leptopilina boulardi TaxID=63433 RepID=UPI0021F5AE67|nr:DNA helicase MCM8-like [Leptopilina boulardi]
MSSGGKIPFYRNNNKWKYIKKKKASENEKNEENKNKNKKRSRDEENVENREIDGYEASNPDDQEPQHAKKKRKKDIPYTGWDLYFHDEEYDKKSETVKKIRVMENYLTENQELISKAHLEVGGPFNLDVNKIYESQIFKEKWPEFQEDLKNNPSHILNCIGVAVHQTIENTLKVNDSECSDEVPLIRVRVLNYLPVVPLKNLRVNYYGQLITIRGCVMRVGKVLQLAQWNVYKCLKCNLKTVVYQPGGVPTLPKKCDCGAMKFDIEDDSPYSKTIPFQKIRLQEHLGDNQDDRRGTLRVIDVELVEDLVDTCMPGADVVVTGIVKGQDNESSKSKKVGDPKFQLHIEAVSITSNKTNSKTKGVMMIDLNYHDYAAISEIQCHENVFALLINSMCPSIYGHELVKAGLLLSLFGGSSPNSEVREDIHVLLVGDPGLGKSQMLIACSRIAPRGVYICGNASTASGLTVTLIKEPGTNDYILEPGALVLANRGCCVIDEFDKMTNQHQALLEAMEQQCVSVAKSGVLWSLPARTSILAAANPIGGHYNKTKTIRENLNLSQPLLSRFDLVYLLLDNPDKDHDARIIQHLAKNKKTKNVNESRTMLNQSTSSKHKFDTFKESLVHFIKNNSNFVPQGILRKYIAYARQYVRPRLTSEAQSVLLKFYLELRERKEKIGNIPIFFRTLEALIRLTLARAKVDLRQDATEFDALDVIEIMNETINNIPDDVSPFFSGNLSAAGGKPTKNKIKAFINLLKQERRSEKQLFSLNELNEIAENGGIAIDDIREFIDQLNEKGFLIKKGTDLYKFLPN